MLWNNLLGNYQTKNLPYPKTYGFFVIRVNALSANPTKWSNTLKQFVGCYYECKEKLFILEELLTICTFSSFQKRKIDVEPTQSVIALPFAVAFVFLAYNYDAVRNFSFYKTSLASSLMDHLQISLLAN